MGAGEYLFMAAGRSEACRPMALDRLAAAGIRYLAVSEPPPGWAAATAAGVGARGGHQSQQRRARCWDGAAGNCHRSLPARVTCARHGGSAVQSWLADMCQYVYVRELLPCACTESPCNVAFIMK